MEVLFLVSCLVVFSEVENEVPSVVVRVEMGFSHVLVEMGVSEVVRPNCKIAGALDDRIVVCIEVDCRVN